MSALHQLYSVNEENLALRRQFIGLGARDVAVLRRLKRWADGAAPKIASEFYDQQFAFSETRAFFERYAKAHGRPMAQLRVGLEKAQAGYLQNIFDEAAAGGTFGTEYFERRLRIGKLHNEINLPLKWYLGSYATYFDLVRAHLWRRFPTRPLLRARAERALVVVFNLDAQAIVEAFYYDTFATIGVDLSQVSVARRSHDLSDHGSELKATVLDTLTAVARVSGEIRQASQEMAVTSDEAGRAVGEIASAVSDVAQGAERQVRVVEDARRLTEAMIEATRIGAQSANEAAQAGEQAGAVATEGAAAVGEATDAMAAVRDSSVLATSAMRVLGAKSEEIDGIVATITGIAEQTNLLALNAAIEAARAGENGRGFAVVAEEVRKLAEESQTAAASIATLIAEIQRETARAVEVVEDGAARTEQGATTVERARDSFVQIGSAVENMHGRVQQIATVIEQITANSGELQRGISEVAAVAEQTSASSQQVSASTQQTSASTQQIAASAQTLAQTAAQLDLLVGRLKLPA